LTRAVLVVWRERLPAASSALLARIVLAFIPLLTLPIGCTPTVHERDTPFDESEYLSYVTEGTGQVSGTAFVKRDRTNVGEKRRPVYLKPSTGYTAEWLDHVVSQRVPFVPPDPREKPAHRSTMTEEDGRFSFEKVSAGEYYLLCPVISEVPGYFGYGEGVIYRTIGWTQVKLHLAPGQRLQIDLSC